MSVFENIEAGHNRTALRAISSLQNLAGWELKSTIGSDDLFTIGTFLETVFERLIEVCKSYGLCTGPYLETVKLHTLQHWVSVVAKTVEDSSHCVEACITFTKYKLAAFFAYYCTHPKDPSRDLPKSPYPPELDRPEWLIGGRVGRWIQKWYLRVCPFMLGSNRHDRNSCHIDVREFIGFLHSLKLSKRSMPRPDEAMAARALVKTFKVLTGPPAMAPCPPFPSFIPDPFGLYRSLRTDDERYQQLFREYVGEMMSGLDLDEPYSINDVVRIPSRSATYINSRSNLGTMGEIFEERFQQVDPFKCSIEDLPQPNFLYETLDVTSGQTIKFFDVTRGASAYWRHMETAYRVYLSDLDTINGSKGDRVPVSVMSPVIEALKVRVISKSPGSGFFLLKPVQERLLKRLCQNDQFISDRPETPESIGLAIGSQLDRDEAFLSVDYSASTDNLNQVWSRVATEKLIEMSNLPLPQCLVWRQTLYGGGLQIQKPGMVQNGKLLATLNKKDYEDYMKCTSPRMMSRGQLMGNIVSFPILCLANGFCLWLTWMVAHGVYVSGRSASYVVNGDDGVLRTTQAGYQFWCQMASYMGFSPSVGKVYFSRDFFDFNSCLFFSERVKSLSDLGRDIRRGDYHLPCRNFYMTLSEGILRTRVHYTKYEWENGYDENDNFSYSIIRGKFLHLGLCHGKNRTGADGDLSSLLGLSKGMSIGNIQQRLLAYCPYSQRVKVMSLLYERFLYNPKIYEKIKGLPWYLPNCVGGIGLCPLYVDCLEYYKSSFDEGDPPEYLLIPVGDKMIPGGPGSLDLKIARLFAYHACHSGNPVSRPSGELQLKLRTVRSDQDTFQEYNVQTLFFHEDIDAHGDQVSASCGFWYNLRSNQTAFHRLQMKKELYSYTGEDCDLHDSRAVMKYLRILKTFFYQLKSQDCVKVLRPWRNVHLMFSVERHASVAKIDTAHLFVSLGRDLPFAIVPFLARQDLSKRIADYHSVESCVNRSFGLGYAQNGIIFCDVMSSSLNGAWSHYLDLMYGL